jgi:AcrR family transcriptional regulator
LDLPYSRNKIGIGLCQEIEWGNDKMADTTSADERRKQIVWKSAELFNQKGYYQTSMEDIAKAVGLRKPTLYWYISGKEEILYLIHDEFVDYLTSQHEERLNRGLTNTQLLKHILMDVFKQITEYPGFVSSFHENYRELSGKMKEQIRVKRNKYFNMVVELFLQGAANGEFEIENPTVTALAFFGMCNWVYKWYDPAGPLQPCEIADLFWKIFMNGISKK